MSDAKCVGNEIRVIHFEDADFPVQEFLGQFDEDHTKALDEFEIKQAGGLDWVMRQLKNYALIPTRGISAGCGEYDLVATFGAEPVIPAADVAAKKVSGSNKIPNGREYPGVIIDIPGGEFEMGSINGQDDEHDSRGNTVRIQMTGFKLAKTEVTVGQYKAYLAATGDSDYSKILDFAENKKGDDYPVVGLKFDEKLAFARYYGGTLPTAAQIEYVSKGPSHNDQYGTPIDKAVVWSNGFRETQKVCGNNDERANGFGICDLAGNVWETTSDKYDESYYNGISRIDPTNPFKGQGYVEFRGGSFLNLARGARAANRYDDYPVYRDYYDGFRVVWPQDFK